MPNLIKNESKYQSFPSYIINILNNPLIAFHD
jgi:hypothetical protein